MTATRHARGEAQYARHVSSFGFPDHLDDLRTRVRAFVDSEIIPAENRILEEDRTKDRTTLNALRSKARAAGLFVPHLPKEHGGLGLGIMGMCALFREMGRSPVGAAAFNCDAPDQGNMDLLLKSATPSVREKWLKPLVAAEIKIGF